MKRVSLVTKRIWLAVVLAVGFGVLAPGSFGQAKDVTGTWQGTLSAGRPLRVVVKITREDGKLKGIFYSLDQGGQPIPVTTIAEQGGTVTLTIAAAAAKLEEKLSADGAAMSGSWSQGSGAGIPLELKRASAADTWTIPEPAPKIEPMAATADPGFEVATIKPSKPDQPGKAITIRGTRVVTINTTLVDLITFAYSLQAKQVVGGVGWMETDKFDVSGAPDVAGLPNVKQMRGMMQKLLVERFGLKFHDERRELTVYALGRGKGELKMTKSTSDNGLPGLGFRGLGQAVVQNATMQDFCEMMQGSVMDRPMVDQTGLPGRWNFQLNWTPDETQFGGLGGKATPPADKADAPPPLFTAIQEQVGLKLEATKAMTRVMAIDHVEKPSEN